MPKLFPEVIEKNKRGIEDAALKLFCARGFHGTAIREIADASGVSTGNIYNYYRTKEQILKAIVDRYHRVMMVERNNLLDSIWRPFDPREWQTLAGKIRDLVRRHGDYWRLMYIDVTEFDNRHFQKSFTTLLHDFRIRFKDGTWTADADGSYRGVDPALAFGAIWMQFFNYFLVETLFQGNRHFGVSDDEFVRQFCSLYLTKGRGAVRERKS